MASNCLQKKAKVSWPTCNRPLNFQNSTKMSNEQDTSENTKGHAPLAGVRLRNFLVSTKMYTAPGIGLRIDKYGHIVSIKDAAKELNRSESTVRRWAKKLEQMNDTCFRWDKKFGLLFYYAA